MRKIALADPIECPTFINFEDIRYPKGDASVYNGESFGFKTLYFSVHYRTCEQIHKGFQLHDLDYFKWTMQKLERLGEKYERFLFSPGKGCGLDPNIYVDIKAIRNLSERRSMLAALSTQRFVKLYDSIMAHWDPSLTTKDILFYKIINHRFVIIEGLHRLSILFYKYRENDYDGFVTDQKNVKPGYYYVRSKQHIKRILLKIVGEDSYVQ